MTRQARARLWGSVVVMGLVVSALTAGVTAQNEPEAQAWLHVQVEGEGDPGERVAVNLPLRAVSAVLAMAPEGMVSSDGQLRVPEEHGVTVSEIRRMWRELSAAGDSEFVAMERGDQSVRVERRGEQLQVRVTEADETVEIDLPVVIVDALLSGEGETLNLAAALELLRELRGDIVRVVEAQRQIRVWVDEQAEQ